VIALCALALLLAVSAAAAHAETPRLVPFGQFSLEGFPLGVAVDNSGPAFPGDVYAATLVAGIDKFDGSGNLVSPPSPFGSVRYSSAALNPANEELYVMHAEATENPSGGIETLIETFDPRSGAPVGSPFPVPTSRNLLSSFADVQIASDSAGDVYVPVVPENEVLEYSPSGTLLSTFKGGGGEGALTGPAGVAVDSSGNLWVADTGNNRIEELSPSDVPLGEIKSEGVQSLALDGRGDVFAIVKNGVDSCRSLAAPCSHLVEYSSAGVQVADIGAGSFETGEFTSFGFPPMVAVDESSGRVYVSDGDRNLVLIFGPAKAPVIGKELSSEVGASEAKLGALVNPGGIQTSYRFEYGTTTEYGSSTPFPEGSVGEGVEARAVWASANDLAPATTYHYRVVATNELAPEGVAGPDQTFTTLTAEQSACPNELMRGGFSARLPDCRAYELVTPSTKIGTEIRAGGPAATDGNAIEFVTHEPLPEAPNGGNNYVARRGFSGWTSEDISPIESYSGVVCISSNSEVPGYSDSLSMALVVDGLQTRASNPKGEVPAEGQEGCDAEGLEVVKGEPLGYENLLLRDNATGTYRLVNAPPPGVTPGDAHFKGASADLHHVVFSEQAHLTENAPYGVENLYESDEGALRLVTVLPDGTPVVGKLVAPPGAIEGRHEARASRPVSADGSHVFFSASGGVYARIDGERTVRVDESQGGPDPSGGGEFWTANADGSRVFFSDENRLTPGSTATAGEPDLYECTLPAGVSKCELTDLTAGHAAEHANVLRVIGTSDDGSRVYYLARGVLASNKREYTNSAGASVAEEATSGEQNVYLEQGGTITFIATLSPTDSGGGQLAPSGAWLTFGSSKSLTGYDNVTSSGSDVEIFLYSAASKQLACASCIPSGEAPAPGGGVTQGRLELSDSGRLFFETQEALVPSDANGQFDVYEYEYEGGRVSLVSSGTSSSESRLLGTSESGDDVFFSSRQALVPQDTQEGVLEIYDARVGGGFPATSAPPPCTTADACRTPVSPQPSLFGAPSSQTFSGAGNLAPPAAPPPAKPKPLKCKRGFVKHKVKGKTRCVPKRAHKARKSAHARKRGHR
jgi:DNA-binding beta-propeller fold protein YncE